MRAVRTSVAAALLGVVLGGGCASKDPVSLPASPVLAPLSDLQAMRMAEDFLARSESGGAARSIQFAEPTGDGHLVAFRTTSTPNSAPPVQSRLVEVRHDGAIREFVFRDDH